ncbi:MAG TPA: hypothetical protein PK786_06595 [Treponemataceae bacterium]|nr:hypothetical protein [Treponemataceae bacterium]
MIFTPGNILTLCITIVLLVLYRQMDKGNRSIEKVKRFGDKLKDDLALFLKERTAKLEESSLALDVQQTKAVAAVKRLEAIRADLEKKEADLLERTKAVSSFGKQIASYDETISRLLEMTRQAEINLEKITCESEFVDKLGRTLAASQKQLHEIHAGIPALRDEFSRENRNALESVYADTVETFTATLGELESRIDAARRESATLVDSSRAELDRIFSRATDEAVRRADALEDTAFQKLKEQATERLVHFKDSFEEKVGKLHEQAKTRIIETQQMVKEFKTNWKAEADEFLEATRAEIRSLDDESSSSIAALREKLSSAESLADARFEEFEAELHRVEADLDKSIGETARVSREKIESFEQSIENRLTGAENGASERLSTIETRLGELDSTVTRAIDTAGKTAAARINEISKAIDSSFEVYRTDVEYRLEKMTHVFSDSDKLEEQLRLNLRDTEQRVTDTFDLYVKDQKTRQDEFEKSLFASADSMTERMNTLESGLNELKSRAYDNVSEKLKMFEDDFFADLAKRSDAITAALDGWKSSVDERLESLSAENEAERRDLETEYTARLQERLADIAEQYHAQTKRLEEQIAGIETELRGKITASDQSILDFVEQSRQEFAHAKDTASLHVQNELSAHAITVQEILRKQERELESRTKEFIDSIESSRTEAESMLEGIRADFTTWQTRNEQQFTEAKRMLDDRIVSLDDSVRSSIADLEAGYQTNYRDFIADTAEERREIRASLDALRGDITSSMEDFRRRSVEALEEFNAAYEEMTSGTALRVREHAAETDQTIRSLKSMVQDIRESVDQTRERLFGKVQSDAQSLNQTIEEIDKKQKAFIAQTRIYDRADEMKASLETSIENIKDEISRLDIYRETMNTLETQYGKVRKLEEEANQKLSKFMAEKKRIDILESDFTRLLALSDSIDRKISELTLTNDDLQQYQVQIRRFEESIAEVNTRYERLEKKTVVLDQTVDGVDHAFENLRDLEKSLEQWKEGVSGIPEQLETIRETLDVLMASREKSAFMIEKLETLDSVLEDVEARTEKMQTAREWLARTETRLEEISKQSQDQLKLLGDLLKQDSAAKKTRGAPPIGIRENVVKLAHQGWKVDEIARALHLSRGEVELILELPQK